MTKQTELERWTERTLADAYAQFMARPDDRRWQYLSEAMYWYQQAYQDVRSSQEERSIPARYATSLSDIVAWAHSRRDEMARNLNR